MALTLILISAKKPPGPVDYSSIQASCSIEGEIAAGQDPGCRSRRDFSARRKRQLTDNSD